MWNNKPVMVLQEKLLDCGPACLLSVIRYYGGEANIAHLRELCQVNSNGASLLHLRDAAVRNGFDAEGMEGDLAALLLLDGPCILHVTAYGDIGHYVVFFGAQCEPSGMMYGIGDPGVGMQQYTARQLESIWVSRAVLVLKPNRHFNRSAHQ